MRISIIGQPGSGKSTLARKISEKFSIPHFQIDRFYLESGGGKLKRGDSNDRDKVRAYVKEKVLEYVNQPSWVSDGSYFKVQPIIAEYAEQIVFLDIPLYRRLLNHFKRIFITKRHKELTIWDDVKFIYRTIRLTPMRKEKFKKFLHEYGNKVKILKNYKEVEKYLDTLMPNSSSLQKTTLEMAKEYLGKEVKIIFDRPLGSKHPKHNFIYKVNYGYIPGVMAGDGEELDAYFLGIKEPLKEATGVVVAIIHRENDDDDKLVVVPTGVDFTDEEIMRAIHFQEQYFRSSVIR